MAFNPQAAADRWRRNASSANARQSYVDGINNFDGNPMQLAAKADDLWFQRIEQVYQSGSRTQKLAQMPREAWSGPAVAKADRYTAGIAVGAPKMLAHMQRFGPVYDSIRAQAAQMPRGTIEDSLARVRMSIEKLKTAAGKPVI